MVTTDEYGNPLPGPWYEDYSRSWRRAFPGSGLIPGHFREEVEAEIWHTTTPGWDDWWFNSQGASMPTSYVADPYEPADGAVSEDRPEIVEKVAEVARGWLVSEPVAFAEKVVETLGLRRMNSYGYHRYVTQWECRVSK